MGETTPFAAKINTQAALDAFDRGYQPIPIRDGGKRPFGTAWTHTHWESREQVIEAFDRFADSGAAGIGLLLGKPSGGLIDVDLDHPRAMRLRDNFLPPSPMQTGRNGRARSHRWYRVTGDDLPSTRAYKMPDRSTSIELRSTGAQTLIPPSVHPSGEDYRWEGRAWGGSKGPAVVDGRKLSIQVALLAMGAVLLENWPHRGGRHEAYLALAGGLLRFGYEGVHPYWERNLPVLIHALADATHDEDGPEARVAEVMNSTLNRLREQGKAVGFPKLAELIGNDHAELTRRMAREVESLGGFAEHPVVSTTTPPTIADGGGGEPDETLETTLDPENRNPMEERKAAGASWGAVDLEPYLSGKIVQQPPQIMLREDGKGLMYPGKVNSIFGKSESAKSFLALFACAQEMDKGDRVLYLDFEDEPLTTLDRLRWMGVGADDIANQFQYVHPEGPLAAMQRYAYGDKPTMEGQAAAITFQRLLDQFDPTLIVADGMTSLYGLHGHNTNDATSTDVITTWLKRLCRGSRTTVIVIDHTGKGGEGGGASPIGAHHKIAMVQGSALRVDVIDRPMPGAIGRMKLVVYKDRPGLVRKISTKDREQVAGMFILDSSAHDITAITIEVPDPTEIVIADSAEMERKLTEMGRAADLRDEIVELLKAEPDVWVEPKALHTLVTDCPANAFRAAWNALVDQGFIERRGAGGTTQLRILP